MRALVFFVAMLSSVECFVASALNSPAVRRRAHSCSDPIVALRHASGSTAEEPQLAILSSIYGLSSMYRLEYESTLE